jgi:hypothetical protein
MMNVNEGKYALKGITELEKMNTQLTLKICVPDFNSCDKKRTRAEQKLYYVIFLFLLIIRCLFYRSDGSVKREKTCQIY